MFDLCEIPSRFKAILVDLNEFPSIFHKVQHSHSRHQKTTSNLLRINLKSILKFNEIWPVELSGASQFFVVVVVAIFSEN